MKSWGSRRKPCQVQSSALKMGLAFCFLVILHALMTEILSDHHCGLSHDMPAWLLLHMVMPAMSNIMLCVRLDGGALVGGCHVHHQL